MSARFAIALVAPVLGAAVPAQALDFIDAAPVVSVTPLYAPVADPRECFVQTSAPQQFTQAQQPQFAQAPQAPRPQQPPPQERSIIAPILGGAAGALLGSQVGSGRGRDAATAVGAVAGTVVGNQIANPGQPQSMTGTIVGGAAGALLGNQVGSGTGRTAATAAGAIGGAMIGDRVMSPSTPPQAMAQAPVQGGFSPQGVQQAGAPMQVVDRCRTVDGATREMLRGYSVVYRYLGRDITTTVNNHPGSTIQIAVGAVDAVAARPASYAAPAPAFGQPAAVPAPAPALPPGYAPAGYAGAPGYPQQPAYAPPPAYTPPVQSAYPVPIQSQSGYTPGTPAPAPSAAQILLQQAPALLAR